LAENFTEIFLELVEQDEVGLHSLSQQAVS